MLVLRIAILRRRIGGLLDDQVGAPVGTEGYDLGGDERPRRGVGLEKSEPTAVLRRQRLGKSPELGQAATQRCV